MPGGSGKQLVRRCNTFGRHHWVQCKLVADFDVVAPSSSAKTERDTSSLIGLTQTHSAHPAVVGVVTVFVGLSVALLIYLLARHLKARAARHLHPDYCVSRRKWYGRPSRYPSVDSSYTPSYDLSAFGTSVNASNTTLPMPPPLPPKIPPRVQAREVTRDVPVVVAADEGSRPRSMVATTEAGPSRGHGSRAQRLSRGRFPVRPARDSKILVFTPSDCEAGHFEGGFF